MQIPCVYLPGPAPAVTVANNARIVKMFADTKQYVGVKDLSNKI